MIDPEPIKLIERYTSLPLDGDDPAELDLYDHLGIRGDDADEMLDEYRGRFGVSLVGFERASHFPNEGEDIVPGAMRRLPWMKTQSYLPLTIGDLQRGIELKYLGDDPATVATMHSPLAPEEEQAVEDAVFRLKNRLIYKPFFIITVISMAGSGLFCWLSVRMGYLLDSWFLPLLIIHPVLMWIFITPRISLLRLSAWMEDPKYHRLQGGACAVLSFVLPVMIPAFVLYKYFETGNGSFLTWAIICFAGGLLAFLAFIHTYPFDPRKLKEYARDKGIDVKALRLK